jgi:hypothetical protein
VILIKNLTPKQKKQVLKLLDKDTVKMCEFLLEHTTDRKEPYGKDQDYFLGFITGIQIGSEMAEHILEIERQKVVGAKWPRKISL